MPSLDKYIDFKRYGEDKFVCVNGAFTRRGCIIYHGYNQNLADLLFENLGMVIRLNAPIQMKHLFDRCLNENVLINPGSLYYPGINNHIRMSYSYATLTEMRRDFIAYQV